MSIGFLNWPITELHLNSGLYKPKISANKPIFLHDQQTMHAQSTNTI